MQLDLSMLPCSCHCGQSKAAARSNQASKAQQNGAAVFNGNNTERTPFSIYLASS